jgi:hypothetical protein
MSEHEIIKHTKKAYSIFTSSEMGIKNKIIDILTEIIIIVFAVSISIGLSNWSESRHERQEEKEFLIGYQKDLQSLISNMTSSRKFYMNTLNGIQYFLSVGRGAALNKDSISRYSGIFFSSTDLDPHISRYEGLKSSGKFKIIENKELLNNIIDLHEAIIQRIQILDEKYYEQAQKLEALVVQNVHLTKGGDIINSEEVLKRDDMIILLTTAGGIIEANIIGEHDTGIKICQEIKTQIDKELK